MSIVTTHPLGGVLTLHHYAAGRHHAKKAPSNLSPPHSHPARRHPSSKVQPLQGNAYECLRRLVHDMQDTARMKISNATKKAHKERRAPPSTSEFVYFDQVMVKVQPRAGDGEAQWVLSDFEEAWRDAARKAATGC